MAKAIPEMKSYFWLQTSDGIIQQVEEEVAMFLPLVSQNICDKHVGFSKSNPFKIPERIVPASLSLALEYSRFHQAVGRSDKEKKKFDDKFIRMDFEKLCELAWTADFLRLNPLVVLISETVTRMIKGKRPEEIREIFNLPDDLTEEEKLEPIKNFDGDARARLLNRLRAKRRSELKEKKNMKDVVVEKAPDDNRSVDDLVKLIEGDGKDSITLNAGRNKKKKSKRKDQIKASSCHNLDGDEKQESNGLSLSCEDSRDDGLISEAKAKLKSSLNEPVSPKPVRSDAYDDENEQDTINGPVSPMTEVDDAREDDYEQDSSSGHASSHSGLSDLFDYDDDYDDGLSPETREQQDREVEEFDRRLNISWPEWVKEVVSQGQGRMSIPLGVSEGRCRGESEDNQDAS